MHIHVQENVIFKQFFADFDFSIIQYLNLLVTSVKPLFEVMQRMSKRSNLTVQPLFLQSHHQEKTHSQIQRKAANSISNFCHLLSVEIFPIDFFPSEY